MAQPKKALTTEEKNAVLDSGISLTDVFSPDRYNDKDKAHAAEDGFEKAKEELEGQVVEEKATVPSEPPF